MRPPVIIILVLLGLGAALIALGVAIYYPAGTNDSGSMLALLGAALVTLGVALALIYGLVRFVKASARDRP